MSSFWEEDRATVSVVVLDGIEVTRGSRVRLRPRPGGDIMDIVLAGKIGIVQLIEQDYDNAIQVVVTIEDDPGADLGEIRQPGHQFFFTLAEIEPIP